jgi:hypothetical protein
LTTKSPKPRNRNQAATEQKNLTGSTNRWQAAALASNESEETKAGGTEHELATQNRRQLTGHGNWKTRPREKLRPAKPSPPKKNSDRFWPRERTASRRLVKSPRRQEQKNAVGKNKFCPVELYSTKVDTQSSELDKQQTRRRICNWRGTKDKSICSTENRIEKTGAGAC